MKPISFALILGLTLLLVTISATAAEKVDFSGTWVLDPDRSEGLPPGMNQTITVKQTGDRVDVEMKISSAQGERTVNDQFILDGKETEFAPGGPQSKGTHSSKWSADGRAFDVNEEATIERGNGPELFKVTRHWQLWDDARTLTIEMVFTEAGAPGKSKRVFVRK